MEATFTIYIPGQPVAKGRARATRQGRMYTPGKTVEAENLVAVCAMQQIGQPVLLGPITVHVEFKCLIPMSWSKKRQAQAEAGTLHPTGKPDIDNATKLAFDALNGIAWKDDAQIVSATISKRYDQAPGTTIQIWSAA